MKIKKDPVPQETSAEAKIMVRLDHRTIMVIKDISALEIWKKKYPDAKIM